MATTVGEFIELLSKYDKSLPVILAASGRYEWSNPDANSIEQATTDHMMRGPKPTQDCLIIDV